MANEEHLAQLQQGVYVWNQWRDANRDIRPDLTDANLTRATFLGADLSRADLTVATLTGATLSLADLTEAHLTKANFSRAHLSRANLAGAYTGWTIFADVNLSTALGLETVQHRGPSTIGIDTLYRSHGYIPEVFLRGAGVPDEMITL
jgi:uncharacterized protein YjbI with pentapeptide repeats